MNDTNNSGNSSDNNDNDSLKNEALYIPEENQTSNTGKSCLLVFWYLFLATVGILAIGFVGLFVVCMV